MTVNWSNLDYDEEDFAEAFRVFDKNGDGRITDKELSQVLKELGIIISEEDIRLMIAELDKDGNGTLYIYIGNVARRSSVARAQVICIFCLPVM